jgi:hypothetical protein
MESLRTILAIARADLLQRVRSYAFLVIMAVTVLSAWQLVPPAGSTRAPMHFGPVRPLNTAAGIGATVACMCILWIALIGFYLVSSAIKRDADTGVGQIIATTKVGKATYLLGKWLANFAVLLAIPGAVCVTLVVVLLVKGEGGHFDLLQLWLPMLVLVPPPLALVAALAVVGEVLLPRWRGAVNILYFFLWTFLMIASMELAKGIPLRTPAGQISDLFAMRTVTSAMEDDLLALRPDHRRGQVAINFPFSDKIDGTFAFHGFDHPFPLFWSRWIWLALAALLVSAVAVPFRRFDPVDRNTRVGERARTATPGAARARTAWRLAIPAFPTRSAFLTLLQSELRLMLLGRSAWWWLVTAGLLVASATAPLAAAHRYILPGLWFWHVLVLSRLGSKETAARTTEIVFSAPRPLVRQLPAALAAGWVLTLALGLPVLLRELLVANVSGCVGVVAGALFLPAAAFALGTWTNGSKLFEVAFTVLWYGAMNDAPPLDFSGASAGAQGPGIVVSYLLLALACVALAVPGRLKQLRGL